MKKPKLISNLTKRTNTILGRITPILDSSNPQSAFDSFERAAAGLGAPRESIVQANKQSKEIVIQNFVSDVQAGKPLDKEALAKAIEESIAYSLILEQMLIEKDSAEQ